MRRYTHKVTFSTDKETFAYLKDRATDPGMTPHKVARALIQAKVKDPDTNFLLAITLLAEKLDAVSQQTERNGEEQAEFRRALGDQLSSLSQFLNKLADRVEATHKMVSALHQAQRP